MKKVVNMLQGYEEPLLKSRLFAGIEREQLIPMLGCLEPRICHYNRNEFIALEGGHFEGVGIILKGETVVMKESVSGSRVVMTILKPGNMFGEMVAFSPKPVWPATVQAQTPCKVLFLSQHKIIGECANVCPWHHSIIQNMIRLISEKALLLNKKVEYLSIKSMRGKISAYLLEQYKKERTRTFLLPMKRNELADFLNVSRPSMSREFGRMRDEGVIDFHMASVRILDLEALRSMAE